MAEAKRAMRKAGIAVRDAGALARPRSRPRCCPLSSFPLALALRCLGLALALLLRPLGLALALVLGALRLPLAPLPLGLLLRSR